MVGLKGQEAALGHDRPIGARQGAGKHRPCWLEKREIEARDLGYTTQPHVVVDRDGQEVTLRPTQLVLATGMSAKANPPSSNSAHDICAALWENNVNVTMVQRSSTHILRSATLVDVGMAGPCSEAAGRGGMTHQQGRHDLCQPALSHPARIPERALCPVEGTRRRFPCRSEKGGFLAGLGATTTRACAGNTCGGGRGVTSTWGKPAGHQRQDQADQSP